MIVSMAIAVLPVWRSPMISSRWPRPIGIRDQRVDRLDAGLDRGVDSLAHDDAGGDPLDGSRPRRRDRALVIERAAEGVDDATEQRLTDRDFRHATRRLDGVAFLDVARLAEDDRSDRLLLEVQGDAHHAARELQQLLRERVGQAVHLRDAVADLHDRADAAGLGRLVEPVDRGLDDADDVV
jgi:hypothetical protein